MKKLLFVAVALLVLVGTAYTCPQCVIPGVVSTSKPGCKCGDTCNCKPGKRADNCQCVLGCPCAQLNSRKPAQVQPGAAKPMLTQPVTVRRGAFGRLRLVPSGEPSLTPNQVPSQQPRMQQPPIGMPIRMPVRGGC